MQQCGLIVADPHRLNRADHDGVGVTLDDFLDTAVDRRKRIRKHRRAGDEGNPVADVEALGALDPTASGEAFGQTHV